MRLSRNLVVAATAIVAAYACSDQYHVPVRERAIVIDPTVSRASELSFDDGDRIGLTVVKNGEQAPYITNAMMTYGGSTFTGSEIVWHTDESKTASLRAYYPYDSSGEPVSFTVRSDQRNDGYTQSDFMTAIKNEVKPTTTAVSMMFRHRLAKINILIINNTSKRITETGILSCAVTADVDVAAESASAAASSPKSDIVAHEVSAPTEYCAIIVPQRAALTFYIQFEDGSQRQCTSMSEADFESGKQFTARLTVTETITQLQLSGQIESWGDNSDLTPGENPGTGDTEEKSSVNWGGVDYPAIKLADGRTWLAANLHYAPAGKSVSEEADDDSTGIWYPCKNNRASTDSGFISEHGYLYSAEAAHGGEVSQGESPVQGVCPDGWHLPTQAEFESLKSAYPTVAALQASGFGFVTGGCINQLGNYITINGGEMYLWSSSATGEGVYYFKAVAISDGTYNYGSTRTNNKFGASVRCIKDE